MMDAPREALLLLLFLSLKGPGDEVMSQLASAMLLLLLLWRL